MMNSTPSTFIAPDGARLWLDAPSLVGGRWSCLFVARVYGTRHAFTVCERGGAERLADALRMTEIQVLQRDAEVMIGYSAEERESLAAWRGRWHELQTHRSGPRPNAGTIAGVFDAFAITDTADGLLVRARSPRQVSFEPFVVYREVPGMGSLRIQRPHEAGVMVPRWHGASARAGEIWRKPFTDGGEVGRARREVLILATRTAISELIPGPDDTPDGSAAAEFLAGLDVSWTAA
jgi:hypothetical protein